MRIMLKKVFNSVLGQTFVLLIFSYFGRLLSDVLNISDWYASISTRIECSRYLSYVYEMNWYLSVKVFTFHGVRLIFGVEM